MRGTASCNRGGRGAPAPRRGRQQEAQAASVEVCGVRGAARRGAPPSAVLPCRGLPGAVRRPPGAARRSAARGAGAPQRAAYGTAAPPGAPATLRRPAPPPPRRACSGRAVRATRRSAMRSQRGRARAPRLEKDALNNRDRHRRAQPLPGRAPARAALQSQWASLTSGRACPATGCPATACPGTGCPTTGCPGTGCRGMGCRGTRCRAALAHRVYTRDDNATITGVKRVIMHCTFLFYFNEGHGDRHYVVVQEHNDTHDWKACLSHSPAVTNSVSLDDVCPSRGSPKTHRVRDTRYLKKYLEH
jgi:hypothetical protein